MGEVEVRTIDWRVELVMASSQVGRLEEPLVMLQLGGDSSVEVSPIFLSPYSPLTG